MADRVERLREAAQARHAETLRRAEAALSDEIVEETRRSILEDRPDLSAASLDRMFSAMARAFPASLVEGHQKLLPLMTNDPGDRYVLAAAVAGGAGRHRHAQRRSLRRGGSCSLGDRGTAPG